MSTVPLSKQILFIFLFKMMLELRAQDEGARGAFDWQLYYKRENSDQPV